MPRESGGPARWWRRARPAPPSTAYGKRRLVFPDDADDHALDDHVPLVHPQRLHGGIGGLPAGPTPGLTGKPTDRGAVPGEQYAYGLAGSPAVNRPHADQSALPAFSIAR